ncbi:MAG: cupin-like domain-containing protein [Candidatus Entotheonellia bacterium]
MKLERRRGLSVEEFIGQYLIPNRPLIVIDAMETWPAMNLWTPDYFDYYFGAEQVQVYDDLFTLMRITSLSQYLASYFGRWRSMQDECVPYVRWYTELKKTASVPWADVVFERLREDWTTPSFLPASGYLVPYYITSGPVGPHTHAFPGRGLFISGLGARTRLHRDPWHSDAVLCQLYGEKKIVMYSQEQQPMLCRGKDYIDISKPDLQTYPDFPRTSPTFEDVLVRGEVLFIPRGWLHHVETTADSISLTWNFVHISTWDSFFHYLMAQPPEDELQTIKFFLRGHSTNS